MGNRPNYIPDEGGMALTVEPGMVVIGNQRKIEANLLGPLGVFHQIVW
jgi:hypothetical protein